ncbi:uncharacterized protein K489DRAFT_375273 [Dissoconium aciculare CBS 342.82]|uniref:Uncharacterized protein n=1 Tax=Dissoconium aciculare CBS 342.82 TaxID=1314786 RepID=A0A6J3MHM1_9PEZI|nr:uncharacterized protein K489DRAFT_375273 [Dissoconium aciculare CBS 342.82]KAF1827189.1 hypothetical protein K489DRAFT_375273 [Dissoconium aciculare CBS 342.82]
MVLQLQVGPAHHLWSWNNLLFSGVVVNSCLLSLELTDAFTGATADDVVEHHGRQRGLSAHVSCVWYSPHRFSGALHRSNASYASRKDHRPNGWRPREIR